MNRIFVTRLARVALAAVILATTSSLVPAAVQPVEASHNHGKIGCGTLVEGTITTSDYNDFWIFSGEADDQVTIRMTSTSGNLDSQVTLWLKDSNGSSYHLLKMAGTAGGNSDAVISNFTLPKTGTYAVGSRRFNGNQGTTTGSYKLTLTCSNDLSGGNSSNSCPKPGGSINWENMITAYNTYNRVETPDGDFWAFRANSGDRIQLWLKSDFVPYLGLYQHESSWKRLAYGVKLPPPTPSPDETYYVSPTYFIDKTVNKSGCYYIWVKASPNSQQNFDDYGDYTLEFRITR